LHREQLTVVELKRKIGDLEGHIQQIEDENSLLREYNGIFGAETDKLYDENKALQEELDRCQIRIPRSLTQQGGSTERPSKRLKSKEKSPEEGNGAAARVRIISQKFATELMLMHITTFLLFLFIF
jgi:predicted RNase H-like nuclease (RuvC/YqgF family)